jgi:hypothetical protein
VSWIPILIIGSISFGLGAFWHSKHARARTQNEAQRNQYRRDVERIARESAIDSRYSYSSDDLRRMGAQ